MTTAVVLVNHSDIGLSNINSRTKWQTTKTTKHNVSIQSPYSLFGKGNRVVFQQMCVCSE